MLLLILWPLLLVRLTGLEGHHVGQEIRGVLGGDVFEDQLRHQRGPLLGDAGNVVLRDADQLGLRILEDDLFVVLGLNEAQENAAVVGFDQPGDVLRCDCLGRFEDRLQQRRAFVLLADGALVGAEKLAFAVGGVAVFALGGRAGVKYLPAAKGPAVQAQDLRWLDGISQPLRALIRRQVFLK